MSNLIKVALNLPIYHTFDYMVPKGMNQPLAGIRVEIPFGRKKMVGITVKSGTAAIDESPKLKYQVKDMEGSMVPRWVHLDLTFFD